MKHLIPVILLIGPLHANDALDVLEGKKNASDISLPPAPEESIDEASPESLVYIDPQWAPSPLDPVWARAILFESTANPWVQQIAVTGFFDFQGAFGDAEVDDVGDIPSKKVDLDGTRTRRARLGARLRAFRNTDIEANVEFSGDSTYRGIERLSARTEISPGTSIQYGKFRPDFTNEYSTEDAYLPYPDRSMLVNMIAPASTIGLRYQQRGKDWDYSFGWFSSDSNPDLPSIEGQGFLSFNLSHTFVEPNGKSTMRTRWHLDYVHNLDGSKSQSIPNYDIAGQRSANGNQLITENPSFRNMLATGITVDQGDFSFSGDFMFAKGDTAVWGLTLSPSYWLVPGTLKLVGRYHYGDSDDPAALITTMGTSSDPSFEDSPFFVGDEYHSFYFGANLHLYEDQMVLMSGFESIKLKDRAGEGFDTEASIWHTGAKVSF